MPLVVLAGSSFLSFESAISAFEKTEDETLEELFPLTHLESLIVKTLIPAENYLITGNLAERDRFRGLSREVDNTFAAVLAAPFDLPEKQVLVRASQKQWQQAQTISEAIFTKSESAASLHGGVSLTHATPVANLSVAQKRERLNTYINQAADSLDQLYKLLIHLQIAENIAEAESIKQRVRLIITMVSGLGLGVAVVAGLVLVRSILLPLRVLEKGVVRFSEGDLSHRIILPAQDELGQLAGTFNNMAEKLEQSQAALKNLATMDGLTGVYNRREFNQRLAAELERSRRYGHSCSLLIVDIDYFKNINDTYGHQIGDEALHFIAALIKQEVRPGDQVARYGGEEFAVIMPETSGFGASAMAERLRDAIATQAMSITEKQIINITVSGGLATFPEDAGSEEILIFAADQALYAAKHSGRNRVVSSNGLSIERDLRSHRSPNPLEKGS